MSFIFPKELIQYKYELIVGWLNTLLYAQITRQCTATESQLLTRYLRIDVKCRKQILLNKIICILF